MQTSSTTESPTREARIAASTLGSSNASHHPRHHHQKKAFTDNFQAFTTTLGHHKYPFRSSVVAWPPLMNSAGILAVGVHERFPSTHCGQQQETPKCCHPKSHGQADAFVQHESMARDFTTSQRVLRSKGLGRLFAPVEPRRELSFQLAITLSTEPSAES